MPLFNPDAPTFFPSNFVSCSIAPQESLSINVPELPNTHVDQNENHLKNLSLEITNETCSDSRCAAPSDDSGQKEIDGMTNNSSCHFHCAKEAIPETQAEEQDGDLSAQARPLSAEILIWNWGVDVTSVQRWRCLPSVVSWYIPHREAPVATNDSAPQLHDFEILRLVGQGGFGKVFQVRKKATGRLMALKAMRKHVVIQELNVEGTRNEKKALKSIQHPFIVRLHCAFHDHGRLFLLMDWHNGGQLLRLIEDHSPLSEKVAAFYLAEIVLAIEELHRVGIVHRDLKPENVLVTSSGHLVVTDFGASKLIEPDQSDIRTDSWVGTEMYMSPEQLQGKIYGRVVDWWAVGVLAWEMVTGDNPFYHSNPEQVALKVQKKKLNLPSHLGQHTHSLLKGLLSRDPERRLGSGGAQQIKEHPFFSKSPGFSWGKMLRMEESPPLFTVADRHRDPEDVSRVGEKYTRQNAVLSPVSPSLCSPSAHAMFADFTYVSPDYSPKPEDRRRLHHWTDVPVLDLGS